MATNILLLPERDNGLQITFATSQDGEWVDPFCWFLQQTVGGTPVLSPVDLTGIVFQMNLVSSSGAVALALSTGAGTLVNGGSILSTNVPVGTMASVPPGTYTSHLHAIADGHTRVVGIATINHGAAV